MSYLTGPLVRGQIKTLMDPKRADFQSLVKPAAAAAASNPMGMPGMSAPASAAPAARPVVGAGVEEVFVNPAGNAEDIIYQPHLLRAGTVHFSSAKSGVDEARRVCLVNPITAKGVDWDTEVPPPSGLEKAGPEPAGGAGFAGLPGFAMNAANYKQVGKDFSEWLYRNQRADIFNCPALKVCSKPGEGEADFRARIALNAREERDAAIDKARAAVAKKIDTLQDRMTTAEARRAKEKAEANASKVQAGVSVLGGILGSLLGRKSGLGAITRGSSAINKAGSAYKQQQDVAAADARLENIAADIDAARTELEAEIARISQSHDPATLALETESIKPARTDVKVDRVALIWLPFDQRGDRAW
jgi:hypothetical protein